MEEEKERLKSVLQLTTVFLAEYNNPDRGQQCWQLFEALCELSQGAIRSRSVDVTELECSYSDLASALAGKRIGDAKYVDNKRLRQLLDTLNKRLEETRPRWEQLAQEHSIDVLPQIRIRQGGGAGNKTVVWIAAVPIDKPELPPHMVELPPISVSCEADIHYYLESLPNLPIWSRWLSNLSFDTHGWRRWLMVFVAVAPYFSIAALCLIPLALKLGLVTGVPSDLLTFLLVYPIVFFVLIGWVPRLVRNSIALLPGWMLPLRLESAVMVLELKDPGTEGYRIRGMEMRLYAAKCPVCHSRVDLQWGGIRAMERIIGVCDRNPQEHRYSFDFTTLTGDRLRR